MCSSTREGELKTPCHVSESKIFITWMKNDLSNGRTQHRASASLLGPGCWLGEQCSPGMPVGPMWSAGGARFESAVVLTIVPPNPTPLDDFASRGTGAEISCVPQSESCHWAVQDARAVLLSFLSPLHVCSLGAAPVCPCPHTPHCRALLPLCCDGSAPHHPQHLHCSLCNPGWIFLVLPSLHLQELQSNSIQQLLWRKAKLQKKSITGSFLNLQHPQAVLSCCPQVLGES